MRSHFTRLALVLAVFAGVAALAAPRPLAAQGSQPAGQAAAPAQPDMKAMMDAYGKAAQPGEHHKRLDSLVGKWTVTGRSWMGPGPATEINGTTESSWALGGRYVTELHKGSFVGMPFEGHGLEGYDNASGEYFTAWIDNMGTGLMVMRGTCEADCKVLTETGEEVDPVTKQKQKSRQVLTFVDADTYRTEMYMVGGGPGGQDLKVMELTSKRVH